MINYSLEQGVAMIAFDDGKANAVNEASVNELINNFKKAEQEADVVVFRGRKGVFSAGFDLKVFETEPVRKKRSQVIAGFTLLNYLTAYPLPLIAVCEGHAMGMGAFFLLASDVRIGADVDCKIGLPETAAALPMEPSLLVDLAKDRLNPMRYIEAALFSKMYKPAAAIESGFIDLVVPEDTLEEAVLGAATQIKKLPKKFYSYNKLLLKKRLIDRMGESLDELRANPAIMFADED